MEKETLIPWGTNSLVPHPEGKAGRSCSNIAFLGTKSVRNCSSLVVMIIISRDYLSREIRPLGLLFLFASIPGS
jgi:hypothetical protein